MTDTLQGNRGGKAYTLTIWKAKLNKSRGTIRNSRAQALNGKPNALPLKIECSERSQ
jgi:hypothetical protein